LKDQYLSLITFFVTRSISVVWFLTIWVRLSVALQSQTLSRIPAV
jgi:hypothetical protein